MKKIFILSSALLAFTGVGSYAAHISPEEALKRVKASSQRAVTGKFSETPHYHSNVGNLYVFKFSKGFMILPDNDEAPALLAYSATGEFSPKGNPGLEYWLEYYNRELEYLTTGKRGVQDKKPANRPTRAEIVPLTKTKWNQEAPYNDLCPTLNGARSVTGCVATAMAQVMKYHNHPEKGIGSHSYNWTSGGKELSFDFEATTFDWANMTDTYSDTSTEAERNAVATLMLACGISVDMDYTPRESGASTMTMGCALADYFNYDKSLWMPMRDYYGIYEWEDMIYADLSKGLPVLYAGRGTAGGHQFVCDGYQGDGYFHFNWGWGGMSDGYFLLTALNPADLGVGGGAGGFNTDQQVALGVKPATAGSSIMYIMYCSGDFLPAQQIVTPDEDLTCTGGFYNYSITPLPKESAIGMRIVASDGSYDHYLESHKTPDLKVLYGYETEKIKFPSLPDGTYTITPAFYDGKEWSEMRTPVGSIGKVIATVESGTAYLSSPQEDSITVTLTEYPATLYIDRKFPLTYSVVNSGSEEYIGEIIPVLVDSEGNVVATSVYRPIDIMPEETLNVSDYIGQFSSSDDTALSPGSYSLILCNRSGKALSTAVEVTLEASPTTTNVAASDFRLLTSSPVTDPANVDFGFTVNCTEGYFTQSLMVAVFPYRSGTVSAEAMVSSDMLFLNAGESKEVTVKANLNNLDNGEYFAMLYLGSSPAVSTQLRFSLLNSATGVKSIFEENKETDSAVYNLQGIRCTDPLSPGIYIKNGRKIVVR